ncbi:hypothetical protein [Streptomyces sp. NPDC058579]|uniref:hypothetical protein n=1 Tax=Streptomyces sp. NPDC058579 TaxID=3346548 RepID=UPI00366A372E
MITATCGGPFRLCGRGVKALAAEAAAKEARYKARVRTVLRSSYSAHWRRMLSPPLGALELKCNNTAYRPVMDAIDLLQRYLDQPLREGAFFDLEESVPLAGVIPEHWRTAVMDGKGRIERVPYELCVLAALRDAVRRREIRVVGAIRWRIPEDDLPADFEEDRDVHYAALGQPQDARESIAALQGKLRTSLDHFEQALAEARREGWRSSRSTASRGSAPRAASRRSPRARRPSRARSSGAGRGPGVMIYWQCDLKAAQCEQA